MNDNELVAHVSTFEASILDRIEDRTKLPFLPGGERGAEMITAIRNLRNQELIADDDSAPSKFKLTSKGRTVCGALWGDLK